jgi:M6 family metalloprotease-like protein
MNHTGIRIKLLIACLAGLALLILLSSRPNQAAFFRPGDAPQAPEAGNVTATLQPVADAYTISDMPDLNTGDAAFLELSHDESISPTVDAQAWLRYDLSGIPPGVTVLSATLHLELVEGGFEQDLNVGVAPVLDEWDEPGITYNFHPPVSLAGETKAIPAGVSAVDWDVRELVSSWLSGEAPQPNFGWNMHARYTGQNVLRFIASHESDQPPLLSITYTHPSDYYSFRGRVLSATADPLQEIPRPNIQVALYRLASWDAGLGALAHTVTTDAQGQFLVNELWPSETSPLTFTLVISSTEYRATDVIAGPGGFVTPDGYIRYPATASPDYYVGNEFRVQLANPPVRRDYLFRGRVYASSPSEPARQVEVTLYGANNPLESERVLAGASTDDNGEFRLPVSLDLDTHFQFFVLQVADLDNTAREAIPGPGAFPFEGQRIVYENPAPGIYSDSAFQVRPNATGLRQAQAPQSAYYRPVVAVILNQTCTCGTANCTTISNQKVLTAFGDTIFATDHESLNNFFLENSQGQFGLQQAGLSMVIPQDDPNTSGNESNNCPNADMKSIEAYRSYFARTVLDDQLNFNFAQYDANHDGTVDDSELMVILAWTNPTEFDAKVRYSDPRELDLDGVKVKLSYASFQAGQGFYTMAHELSHTIPFESIMLNSTEKDTPGDMYNGNGTVGTYGLMDNSCYGIPLTVTQNTPYTATQRMFKVMPNLDPWTKIALGWITPITVTGSGWYTIDPLENESPINGGSVYRLGSSQNKKEYFLVENRRPESSIYEKDLLDSGLAIWHINESYLPNQRQVVTLERAGIGTNSPAATNHCPDSTASTALFDGTKDFWKSSSPNSLWNNGSDSKVGVMCIGSPSDDIPAYLSSNWTGTLLARDDAEPNDSLETASEVIAAYYDFNLDAPCDTDYYTITHWISATISVSVDAYYDQAYTQPAPKLQVSLENAGFSSYPTYQGVGSVSGFYRDYGATAIKISGATTPVYYKLMVFNDQSNVPPDRFDDQMPISKQRNDSFTHSAVISETLKDAYGFSPSLDLEDLNLEKSADIDYFTIQLPPAIDPNSGYKECLLPSDPQYGTDITQGGLLVQVTPFFKRPFTISAYKSDGSSFTQYDRLGKFEMYIECPHDHLSDDKLVFSFDDPSGKINFYEVEFFYKRWDRQFEFPHWLTLTEPPLFKPLPEYFDPWLKFIYPAALWVQEELFAGTASFPLPTEYLPFYWSTGRPFRVDVITQPGDFLNVRLYNAQGEIVPLQNPLPGVLARGGMEMPTDPQASAGNVLATGFLPPGWYALGIDGSQGLVQYWVRFAGRPLFLPLIRR